MNNTIKIDALCNYSNELELQKIEPTEKQIEILYELLKLRAHPISHADFPQFDEHKIFVINNPYRVWMLVYQNQIIIGTFYISYDNSIGVSLTTYSETVVKNLIAIVIRKYKPLPPIKSVRGKRFHINLNPSNQEFASILEKIGLLHIQSTYAIY